MQFIVAGDLHLRSDRPRCRTDEDWMDTQMNALRFLLSECLKRGVPLILTGDIFHRAVSSIDLVNAVMSVFLEFPEVSVYSLPGNHDLPYHNLENIDRCAYGILEKAGILKPQPNLFPFGTESPEKAKGMEVIGLHMLIMEKDPGFHIGSDWMIAEDVIDGFPDAKWILTGDCHDSFIAEKDRRYLINPGCMLIQSAGMIDHTCTAYFVDTDAIKWEAITIPDNGNVVADYLTEEKERDERIQAFVSQMKTGKGLGLSFEDNLDLYYQNAENDGYYVSKEVRLLIDEVTV